MKKAVFLILIFPFFLLISNGCIEHTNEIKEETEYPVLSILVQFHATTYNLQSDSIGISFYISNSSNIPIFYNSDLVDGRYSIQKKTNEIWSTIQKTKSALPYNEIIISGNSLNDSLFLHDTGTYRVGIPIMWGDYSYRIDTVYSNQINVIKL